MITDWIEQLIAAACVVHLNTHTKWSEPHFAVFAAWWKREEGRT